MKFSEEFIDKVREASDLVQIISQHVDLKRSGNGFQGLCPFHSEKSPSFSVSDTKQVYHCFGCKASGNVFKFVENYQGLTFPEAVEYLAGRAGIPLPEPDEGFAPNAQKEEKSLLYRINAFASEFYHQRLQKLPKSHEAHVYLQKRGFTDQDIEKYKLGWAANNWSDLSEALARKNAPMDLAEKLGLSKKRKEKTGHFDLFRGRIIYPIFSPTEKCLGFGGRVLTPEEQPKYLNSPDSVVFHKGQVFYGLNWSAKYLRSKDRAIVVEGYMDWIALDKVGIPEVVATLGTALTERHAKLLKRYTDNVTVLFDGDSAGRGAARRSLPILLAEGLYVKGVFLPGKQDPDDFVKNHGVEALNHEIDKAPDLFNLLVEEDLKSTGSSPSDKTKLIEEMKPILEAVENSSLRSLYIESLASYLNVSPSLIRVSGKPQAKAKFEPTSHRGSDRETSSVETAKPPANTRPNSVIRVESYTRVEQELLNVCLLRSVYLDEVIHSGVIDDIKPESLKSVFSELVRLYRQDPNKFDTLPASLSQRVEPGELLSLHLSPPFQALTAEAGEKVIQDCIKRLRTKNDRAKEKELINNLGRSHGQDQQNKLEQIMNSQRDRKTIKPEIT